MSDGNHSYARWDRCYDSGENSNRNSHPKAPKKAWAWLQGLGASVTLVCGLALPLAIASAGSAAAQTPAASAAPGSYDYVRAHQPYSPNGAKTCLGCHNSHPVNFILQNPMGNSADSRTPMGQQGCESCHGAAGDHAKGMMVDGRLILPPVLFKAPKINAGVGASPVAVQNAVCLTCHTEDSAMMNWVGSTHDSFKVSCTSCHTVHAVADPVMAKSTQPAVCFQCHVQIRNQSYEYSHHPIREGEVTCSDCHAPMGSPGPDLLKEFTVNETCYTCHADKRGPMLFEHQPVRESCLNCHTPHGSNQPHLLIEPLNFLCSSCHSATSNSSGGAFGGAGSIPHGAIGNGMVNSALANQEQCTNCHSQVHGSNSPSGAYFFN